MKRYWLFMYYEYEAQGGLDDLKETGNTIVCLKEKAKVMRHDCAHIVDTKTWTIVAKAYRHWSKGEYTWEKCSFPIKVLQKKKAIK